MTRKYRIQPGDSLEKLVNRFRVSISEMAEANPNVNLMALKVDQIVIIPTKGKLYVIFFYI